MEHHSNREADLSPSNEDHTTSANDPGTAAQDASANVASGEATSYTSTSGQTEKLAQAGTTAPQENVPIPENSSASQAFPLPHIPGRDVYNPGVYPQAASTSPHNKRSFLRRTWTTPVVAAIGAGALVIGGCLGAGIGTAVSHAKDSGSSGSGDVHHPRQQRGEKNFEWYRGNLPNDGQTGNDGQNNDRGAIPGRGNTQTPDSDASSSSGEE